MLEEKFIDESKNSVDKGIFVVTLLQTLNNLREIENVENIYINFNMNKIELYIFNKEENFDTENIISEKLAEWEQKQCYFPETFINISGSEMNILPRTAIKVC